MLYYICYICYSTRVKNNPLYEQNKHSVMQQTTKDVYKEEESRETRLDMRTGLVESIDVVDQELRIRLDEIKAMVKAEIEAEKKAKEEG